MPEIVHDILDARKLVQRVASENDGAVVSFAGIVRGKNQGKKVLFLEYEAYPEMAEGTLRQIGAEIRARWETIREVAIVHRVGRLEIGEAATVIAISAAHRSEVFDALRYAIDRLKEIAPIWKKEVWADGEEWKSEIGPE